MEPIALRWLRISSLGTLLMIGLSWPLWVSVGDVPRVPFVLAMPRSNAAVSWILFALWAVSLGLTGFARNSKPWFGVGLILGTALILQDQHRFQPWLYLHLMIGFLLTTLPPGEGLRYARWWLVSLYIHSGLSKLDRSFVDELGAVFLATLGKLTGFDPSIWPDSWRLAAVLAMPVLEILVGVLLLAPRTRKLGVAGASILHLGLIAILGPWGLGHSLIVLVWNTLMLVQVWIGFGAWCAIPLETKPTLAAVWLGWIVKGVFWLGVLLPFGEGWELFDAWPSHALYASHVGRVDVLIHESEFEDYPVSVRRHLKPTSDDLWLRLDLTGWSREERGTPVYPQTRACLGLAEGLVARYGAGRLVKVVIAGPANRWSGRRSRSEILGFDALSREAARFRVNAHSAPFIDKAK